MAMHPDGPYFIILLCHQGESAAIQWVNQYLPMHLVNPLSGNAPYFIILLQMSNARQLRVLPFK